MHDIPDALERFRKKTESFSPLLDIEFQQIADALHKKHCRKGMVLLREGSICRKYYFIISGCIRSFSLKEGREVNLKFYFEDDIVSDFASYSNQEPSDCYLVAMEDTNVFYLARPEIASLSLQIGLHFHLAAENFFRELYIKEEEHSNNFKLMSPEERYDFVLEHYPQYMQRVPLVHLTSYLGMSRKTITRIRSKIK